MSVPTSPTRTSCDERAAHVRFRRAITLILMTLVLPGSAQLIAGNRRVGRIALRIAGALAGLTLLVGLYTLFNQDVAFDLATSPTKLLILRFGLIAIAIGWAWLFFDAWRISQPPTLRASHRRVIVALNAGMCMVVAGVLVFSSQMVGDLRGVMTTVFNETKVSDASGGRYNILILGGDSGADRWGLRPDSMTVASMDADTGKTVLVGLPRNMANFHFEPGSVMAKQFPDGWGGDGQYLNGLSTWAEDHKDLWPDSDQPGIEATIEGIEGITGLKINYWVFANMKGFDKLVDAVGGVTLNVRQPIPVGGLGSDVTHYIEPGERKLNGEEVLWFSRAREGSDDYSRMARQKCVMAAMLSQLSPTTALTRFGEIADASSSMVSTSIPAKEVDTFAKLGLKAKGQKIATVSLVPPAIITANPDEKKIRRMIKKAITPKKAKKKPAATSSATAGTETPTTQAAEPETVTGGSVGSLKSGYAANQSDDLASAC